MDKSDQKVLEKLAVILAEQQGISSPVSAGQRLCRDLGVCGGDFQDFMSAAWEANGLPNSGGVELGIPEDAITLADVVKIIGAARLRS
ncbi:hypothetical protein [Sphingomonas alba]|uniref:Uncharacterized protein n=1 Tax=Sphingomonas alba TaxID=2908208 RepID=A0ABT0RPE5_9SPHN|nr:hypothetical protein [Sphingomonas alba]MCL6684460.1 hypothetical protein [Sphingomonas alba]